MTSEEEAISKYIIRIQKKLVQKDLPEEKALKYLHNLNRLPVTVQMLKTTGIGKTLGEMKKREDSIGKKSLELVTRWKNKFCSKSQKISTNDVGSHKNETNEEQTTKKDRSLHDSKMDKKSKDWNRTLLSKTPDHWKDVSLNLLGDQNVKAKKRKKSKESLKTPTKEDQQNKMLHPDPYESQEKKRLISVRRDPAMPSLPDIELPEIQRVYRPLRFSAAEDDSTLAQKKKKANVSESEFAANLVSRKSRTQVFSGRRFGSNGVVQTLYQQCMKILMENIEALEDTGGVPYEILEPVLAKTSPAQLIRLEEFNPYFTEDTGELWKIHCQREFRGQEPEDMESWREMYLRKCTERAEKLKNIQSKITESQAKKDPVRQAKLAYVAGPPKPSPQIMRKQVRHGTGSNATSVIEKQKSLRTELQNRHKEEASVTVPFVKIPKRERCSSEAVQPRPRNDFVVKKTTSKPMMKAALKMMKNQRIRGGVKIIRK